MTPVTQEREWHRCFSAPNDRNSLSSSIVAVTKPVCTVYPCMSFYSMHGQPTPGLSRHRVGTPSGCQGPSSALPCMRCGYRSKPDNAKMLRASVPSVEPNHGRHQTESGSSMSDRRRSRSVEWVPTVPLSNRRRYSVETVGTDVKCRQVPTGTRWYRHVPTGFAGAGGCATRYPACRAAASVPNRQFWEPPKVMTRGPMLFRFLQPFRKVSLPRFMNSFRKVSLSI
jgi:hypothetical protein